MPINMTESLRLCKIGLRLGGCNKKTQAEDIQMNDSKILAHKKWNCKYHIVFAPKYRRKMFYAEQREAIMKIIKELCT